MSTNVNVSRYDYGDYYRGRAVVAAAFEDRADAERAIGALRDAGFPGDRIGVALRDRTAQGELVEETGATGTKAAEGAATGAVGGGLLGGLVGLLVGLGAQPARREHTMPPPGSRREGAERAGEEAPCCRCS